MSQIVRQVTSRAVEAAQHETRIGARGSWRSVNLAQELQYHGDSKHYGPGRGKNLVDQVLQERIVNERRAGGQGAPALNNYSHLIDERLEAAPLTRQQQQVVTSGRNASIKQNEEALANQVQKRRKLARKQEKPGMPKSGEFTPGLPGGVEQNSASFKPNNMIKETLPALPQEEMISGIPIKKPTAAKKSSTTQASNNSTAGSEVSSTTAAGIPGYVGSVMGGAGMTVAGGIIGGGTSYATGGEFGQGFVTGSMVAGGAYLGSSAIGANKAALGTAAKGEGFVGGAAAALSGAGSMISGASTAARRSAMLGGAGLGGAIFGGDRRSHRRGFNQSRGSRI